MRAQKGEQDALRILCGRYNLSVYQYVRWKIKDYDNAKDITSQVFARVIDNLDRLGPPYNFKSWLYTIVNNAIKNFKRDNSNQPGSIEDDIPDESVDTEKFGQHNFYNPLSLNVVSILKKLDPIEEQVLYLRHFKDLNYSEIAEQLGKTENNVRLIMHRAKKKFQSLYLQKFKSPIYLGGEKNEKE